MDGSVWSSCQVIIEYFGLDIDYGLIRFRELKVSWAAYYLLGSFEIDWTQSGSHLLIWSL